ncbi:transcriptional repressor [Candidatus Peregrinibacteria bacterium]|nr:MAG: transcriptional repressor [Candidatus Peregrinibacteria bacterium]
MKGYKAFLSGSGVRNTAQRRKIYAVVMHQSSHFTIDDIVQLVPSRASQATVYRMIGRMKQIGLIDAHTLGEKTVYEVAQPEEHHDHLVCEKCGHIEEFICPEVEELQEGVAAEYGFRLVRHEHVLTGICSKCQENAEEFKKKH